MEQHVRFKKGDIVSYRGKCYYFVDYNGKEKYGDGPWIEKCIICPLKSNMKPDLRKLNSRRIRFTNSVSLSEINGDW
jgi:hypothetical protein